MSRGEFSLSWEFRRVMVSSFLLWPCSTTATTPVGVRRSIPYSFPHHHRVLRLDVLSKTPAIPQEPIVYEPFELMSCRMLLATRTVVESVARIFLYATFAQPLVLLLSASCRHESTYLVVERGGRFSTYMSRCGL